MTTGPQFLGPDGQRSALERSGPGELRGGGDVTEPAKTSAIPQGTPGHISIVNFPELSLTLVEGTTFCVSDSAGDIEPAAANGLFVRDTRVVSKWRLRIDGAPVEPLSSFAREPFHGQLVGRGMVRAGQPEATLVVERDRYVGAGMREDLTIRNYGIDAVGIDVLLEIEADFADIFAVKDRRAAITGPVTRAHTGEALVFQTEDGSRGARVLAAGAQVIGDALMFRPVIPAGGTWSVTLRVVPIIDGQAMGEPYPVDRPLTEAGPSRRLRAWREAAPSFLVGNAVLGRALLRSQRDLGALRIEDPAHPADDVVAAGAPWFMALFGRDSILTSQMMVPFAPELAMGTLRTLARFQGTSLDLRTDEEPGRILHEVRLGADFSFVPGGSGIYYGSIDSTPLFVMLCGRALRWGAPADRLAELRPAVEKALNWIVEFGDRDGDGFVEYQRGSDRGLVNQCWKDSIDSMSFSGGRLASTPIAAAEVQGYVYAAYLAAAELFRAWGDAKTGAEWTARAALLKKRFHEAFWMPEHDFYAMALDGEKAQLDVVSSNIGHVLWSGLADEGVASKVVDRLLAPEMFTGFGIRTLSSEAARYNPTSYHNGSIWPHDTAIVAAGMAAVGRRDGAEAVICALIDSIEAFDGRLPELFCGFDRVARPVPVPYPAACRPQAWAAAVPFELFRISLDLDIDLLDGRLQSGAAPSFLGEVVADGLRAGDRRFRVHADRSGSRIEGLDSGGAATADAARAESVPQH